MANIFRGLKHKKAMVDVQQMTDNFAGWKTLSKTKLMYLEVIMREAGFS